MDELKTNAKHLTQDEQFQMRKNIVRLSKKGCTSKEIAERLDVNLRLVQATKKPARKKASMASSADGASARDGS
jgi:DNA-binding CsgD family transcriptional regulator